MRTCQYLTQEDEEELLHRDFEEFGCQVPGCKATFSQLIDSEFHYASKHSFACSVCNKSLPSSHLLALHISENHDSFFEVLSQKKPAFECLLETCANAPKGGPKFWTSEERNKHCIETHQFPKKFKFDDYKKAGKHDKKISHPRKNSKSKEASNTKPKIPAQKVTRSQDYHIVRNTKMEIEHDEEMNTDESSRLENDSLPSLSNEDKLKMPGEIKSTTETQQISNKYNCDKSSATQYLTQKSHDPSNRRFSLAPYSKQISVEESNVQDNPGGPIKRSPVSLAAMGERLSHRNSKLTSNNRHSVCYGTELQVTATEDDTSHQRRSLSPNSNTSRRSLGNIVIESTEQAQTYLKSASEDCGKNNSQRVFSSPSSPVKNRRNSSKSNIPVFIGRSPSVNQSAESPQHYRSNQSMDYLSKNARNKPMSIEENSRSRRSSFPRNSFSSATSNSSLASVTNESQNQNINSRLYSKCVKSTSPIHKRHSQHTKNESDTMSNDLVHNNFIDDTHVNNNASGNNNQTIRSVPLSPAAKSRIPVLRSSSCRSVSQSSPILNIAKPLVPKTICFGHGVRKSFQTHSNSTFKNGQHWYQISNKKENNSKKIHNDSTESEQNNMDTNSVMEKCDFDELRIALD